MLKKISPLLSPDALYVLASMGHGDEIAIVDANFPASQVAARYGARLLVAVGVTSTQMLEAVLTLLPLDDFEQDRAWTMEVVGDANAAPLPVREFADTLSRAGEPSAATLERHAFYARSERAYAVIQTGDTRKYANILLRKGVISTD